MPGRVEKKETMDILLAAGRSLAFVLGMVLVVRTIASALVTFVVPRSIADPITRSVFVTIRRLFNLRTNRAKTYQERDRVMALYAPVSLLILAVVWLILVATGYMAIYWAVEPGAWTEALKVSGSSLLTLGFASLNSLISTILAFSEATLGLILVALLIAYLPTIYSAFSRREAAVTMLDVRAGSPPSAIELFQRYQRIHGLDHLNNLWTQWEVWFVELEESHTSLAALAFFRSPQPERSWITAAGAILDAAALAASSLDLPRDPQAALCIRAGFLALRRIADFFSLPYDPNPKQGDPISVTRQEYDKACEEIASAGIPLKADREQAWRDFQGWRVNYDAVLLALAALIMAPYAPWSSDRGVVRPLPPLRRPRQQRQQRSRR